MMNVEEKIESIKAKIKLAEDRDYKNVLKEKLKVLETQKDVLK